MLVMGIDLGTQGARAIIADTQGRVKAQATSAFPPSQVASSTPGVFEQDQRLWRKTVFEALGKALADLAKHGGCPRDIEAISVTSTSGTVCLVEANGDPVGPAIMYSDMRAAAVADEVQAAGRDLAAKLGTAFSASFALTKLRWLQLNRPRLLGQVRWFLSPTDVVIGWLSGEWGRSDWTNALKWGYDVVDLRWPPFIEQELDLPRRKFPQVQAPGSLRGGLAASVRGDLGLSARTRIVAGSTDGTASMLASGAGSPGEWNSTLGTTLVLKGVSETLLRDPLGRIYCHRHPDGYWLPGGASSTGADCLAQRFDARTLDKLNSLALAKSPTDLLVYPLMRRGERFPFRRPEARGFVEGEYNEEAVFYAAHLEGIAYVERLSYQVVRQLGATVGDTIYVAGGATQSRAGLQIRADVLNKRLRVPDVPAGAMGAAILAARGRFFGSTSEAVGRMVHFRETIEPRPRFRSAYQERYQRFVQVRRDKGYLP